MAKKGHKSTKNQLELKEESNKWVTTEMESQRKIYEQTTADVLLSQNPAYWETSVSTKDTDGEIDSSMSLDEIEKKRLSLCKERMETEREYVDKLKELYDKFGCDPKKNHEKIVKYGEDFLSRLFDSYLNDLPLTKEMLYSDYDELRDKFAEWEVTLEDVANELSKIENLQLRIYIVKKLISKEKKIIKSDLLRYSSTHSIFLERSDGNKNLYNPKAKDKFNEITWLWWLGIKLYRDSDYDWVLYGYNDKKLWEIRDAIKKMWWSNYSIRYIDFEDDAKYDLLYIFERKDTYYFPLFFDWEPFTTWQKEYFQMHPEIKDELEYIKTPNKEIQDLYHEYINITSKLQRKKSELSKLYKEKEEEQTLSKWSKWNVDVYIQYKKDKNFIEKYGESYAKKLLEKVKEVVDLYPEIDLSKNWNKLIQFIIAIDDVENGKSAVDRNHYRINTLKWFDPEHIVWVFLYDKTTFVADGSEYWTEVIVLNGGDIQRQYFKYRDAMNYKYDDRSNCFHEILGVSWDDDWNVKIDVTADKIITLKFDNAENEVSEYAIINEWAKLDFKNKVQSYKDNWLKRHTLNKTFLPGILTKFTSNNDAYMATFQGEVPYEKASVFDEVINYNQWLAAVIIKTQSDENNRCWRQFMYYGYIITPEWYQCLWQDNIWDREIHEQRKTIGIKATHIIKMWIKAREEWKLKGADLVDN